MPARQFNFTGPPDTPLLCRVHAALERDDDVSCYLVEPLRPLLDADYTRVHTGDPGTSTLVLRTQWPSHQRDWCLRRFPAALQWHRSSAEEPTLTLTANNIAWNTALQWRDARKQHMSLLPFLSVPRQHAAITPSPHTNSRAPSPRLVQSLAQPHRIAPDLIQEAITQVGVETAFERVRRAFVQVWYFGEYDTNFSEAAPNVASGLLGLLWLAAQHLPRPWLDRLQDAHRRSVLHVLDANPRCLDDALAVYGWPESKEVPLGTAIRLLPATGKPALNAFTIQNGSLCLDDAARRLLVAGHLSCPIPHRQVKGDHLAPLAAFATGLNHHDEAAGTVEASPRSVPPCVASILHQQQYQSLPGPALRFASRVLRRLGFSSKSVRATVPGATLEHGRLATRIPGCAHVARLGWCPSPCRNPTHPVRVGLEQTQ